MSSPAAPPTTTVSLRQLIELGSQDKPWAFVPVAHRALSQVAQDPELWFLLVKNLADLGLATLASEQLEALCKRRAAAATLPRVLDLQSRIAELPDDLIPKIDQVKNAELAVEALAERGTDLGEAFALWRAELANQDAFRAHDGNIVRRVNDQLIHLGDQIGAAGFIGEQHIANATDSPAPFTIEGIDPPWLFVELAKRTPMLDTGYQPGIRVVQADALEFLDGCSMTDLSPLFKEARVEVFLGTDASEKLSRALEADAGSPLAGPYMPLRSLQTPCTPAIADLIRSAITQQDTQHRQHLGRLHTRDAKRDESYWRKRLVEATDGKAEPLRILITTCRFTTVLHSMCQDLAESLRGLGCTVELLTEPGPHRRLSPLAYSRAIDTLDPDIILAPNYTRIDLEKVITGTNTPPTELRVLPVGVPYVVWVQDAMPHLLTTQAGASIGPLDIALGYISLKMIQEMGYPRDSVEPAQLVASTNRFGIHRVDARLADEFACDVAMMTHHSETPKAMCDRLLDELSSSQPVRRLAESMLPEINHIASNPMSAPGINSAARHLIDQCTDLDFSARELLLQNYVLRIIDRTLRHESAQWASQICQERGWTFKIFGRGWQEHPSLSHHAMGELPHGDALASAYAAAGLTLHISAFNPLHQRLIECSLSGGCPMVRRTIDTFQHSLFFTSLRIRQNHEPDHITDSDDGFGPVSWYDHMLSRDTAWHSLLNHRCGTKLKNRIPLRDPDQDSRIGATPPMQLQADPAWLLGDLDEMTYESKSELESAIKLAREHPQWRLSAGGGIAKRAQKHFTHDALAAKLINKIRQRATQCATGSGSATSS